MILAIDTATRNVSLALHDGDAVIAEAMWRSADHHTVEMAPALYALLSQAKVAPTDLSALAVTLGPGSYTGLRIGMSLAKGLSLAADPPLPIIGIPTLDVVAAAQPHIVECLCAVLQAGRGRVDAGLYRWQAGSWQAVGSPFLATWSALVERLAEPAQVAGEIDRAGRETLAVLGDRVIIASGALGVRRASFLAELAYRRLQCGGSADPATVAPIYLS